jgi:hypothetical protein
VTFLSQGDNITMDRLSSNRNPESNRNPKENSSSSNRRFYRFFSKSPSLEQRLKSYRSSNDFAKKEKLFTSLDSQMQQDLFAKFSLQERLDLLRHLDDQKKLELFEGLDSQEQLKFFYRS